MNSDILRSSFAGCPLHLWMLLSSQFRASLFPVLSLMIRGLKVIRLNNICTMIPVPLCSHPSAHDMVKLFGMYVGSFPVARATKGRFALVAYPHALYSLL